MSFPMSPVANSCQVSALVSLKRPLQCAWAALPEALAQVMLSGIGTLDDVVYRTLTIAAEGAVESPGGGDHVDAL